MCHRCTLAHTGHAIVTNITEESAQRSYRWMVSMLFLSSQNAGEPRMSKIVLSYRRSDSEAMTGRIHDYLVEHYGDDFVFMDNHDIPLGVDFRAYISDVIHGADLLLAIVGRKWLGRRGGGNRIKDERDPVRAELEAAMKAKLPIIPILVDDAGMPKPNDLPE